MITEGAFGAKFVEFDVTFKNDFCRGRYFQIDGLALHQLDRLLAEESGDDKFFNLRRRGDDSGKSKRWLGAYGDGDFHGAAGTISGGKHGASSGAGHDIDAKTSLRRRGR